ncbi:MAG: MmgE/PrpD family protein [Pseudomonadota bacterium]
MSGLLDAVIAHKARMQGTLLPSDALQAVKTFILDSLAVGIAGFRAPLTEKVRAAAIPWGPLGTAPLFGPGSISVSAGAAAFVNGFQIHCQEYDCVHEPAVVHPMATIFAALSADVTGRRACISGSDFATAISLAVDFATTLGVAVQSPIRFFRPANAGLFGATLGICALRKLNDDQTRDAIGYALSFNAGTMQAHVEGKPALPLQIAHAARASVMACDLAEAGVPGTHDSLEGSYGYFALFEEKVDITGLAETLGRTHRILEVSHKPFPTGRAAQGGIVLAQKVHDEGIAAQQIESLILSAPPLIERLVGRPLSNRMTANYARLCFPYVGAVTLRKGTVGLQDFSQAALEDSATLCLAKRIRVQTNHITSPSAFTPQTLTVQLTDGSSTSWSTETVYGSPNDPMDQAAQKAKLASCLQFAYGLAQPDFAEDLWGAVFSLEELGDINSLFSLADFGEA